MDISYKNTKTIKKRKGIILLQKKKNCSTNLILDSIKESYLVKCLKVNIINKFLGILSEGCPQGMGTYKWANGNVYEGDW